MDMTQLREQFQAPPAKFGFAPFWFLNHELDDDELRWQINEMKDNGIGGFILHPRHGLITEYLSEEWFERMRVCIEEAHKLGMKAYLYDENNWPSGPVDGRVFEKHPEYRQSCCVCSGQWNVSGGKTIRQKLDTRDGLIAVVAAQVDGGILRGLPNGALLLDAFVDDDLLFWEAPPGAKWSVMVFARKILRGVTFFDGYLDTLNKDAVAEFIRMTHGEYTARFAGYYGGTVDGMFTDEPTMCTWADDEIPFTPSFAAEFSRRHGYDLYSALPAAFFDAGERTAQLRCDYWDTATNIYQQSYFKQIYDYCDPLRLNSIGHVFAEGEFYLHAKHQGDFFRSAKYMHFGGCDQLGETTWPTPGSPWNNNLLAPKFASSAAHLFNKPRTMCESFGCASGWKIDLRNLKWMSDWLIVNGVNLLGPHAFYYSVQGVRKWECPPGEFYQSAFWPYYRYLADYAARLCTILSDAKHSADVAVLYPIRSMWSAIDPTNTELSKAIITGFELVTNALLRAGFDFDIVPEEELIDGNFTHKLEHKASGERYKALVIPPVTTLLAETASFIAECADRGANVVLVDRFPDEFVSRVGTAWSDHDWNRDLFAAQFGREYDLNTGAFSAREGAEDHYSAVHITEAADADEYCLADHLSDTLPHLFSPDVVVHNVSSRKPYCGHIVHCHYRKGEIDFYFFVNTSREQACSAAVSLDALGVPSMWNTETGEVVGIDEYDFDGERTAFKLDFEPCESHLISISPTPICEETVVLAGEPKFGKVISLSGEWSFTTARPNVLPLAEWRFTMASHAGRDAGGASHIYETEFECDAVLTTARLAIDGLVIEKIWRRSRKIHVDITLNGEKVGAFEKGEYIDHHILEADVLPLIKQGRNKLRIVCNTQLLPAGSLSDPAYLIGDFHVSGKAGKWKLVPASGTITTGDWASQGYPFYSGIGCYTQTVTLPRTTKRVYLRMAKPGDVAEVVVNGEFAAVLPWEPWVADITDLVKSGDNEITIKVANSMTNVFLLESKPSGVLGEVEIAIAR